jgi:hypothetical protein
MSNVILSSPSEKDILSKSDHDSLSPIGDWNNDLGVSATTRPLLYRAII